MKYFSRLSAGVAYAANGEPTQGIPWETNYIKNFGQIRIIRIQLFSYNIETNKYYLKGEKVNETSKTIKTQN